MFPIQVQRNPFNYDEDVQVNIPSCTCTTEHDPMSSTWKASQRISTGETAERINACDPVEPHLASFLFSLLIFHSM